MHSAARKPSSTSNNGVNGNGVAFSVDKLFGDTSTPKRSHHQSNLNGGSLNSASSSKSILGSSPIANGTFNVNGNGSYTPKSSLLGGKQPFGGIDGSSPGVVGSSPSTSSMSSTPLIPFSERKDKLSIQESLNGHLSLPTAEQRTGTGKRVGTARMVKPDAYNYRIAYERPMERSEALDSAIDEAAELLKDCYGIEEYGDASLQSQDDVIVCGRLCPETDGVKMTETSTWLESSRSLGSGVRVLLKFQPDMKVRGAPVGVGGVGLFPGCMVALRGKNGGGKLFAVDEVLMMPPLDAALTAPSTILKKSHGSGPKELDGNPMSMIIASGPYTLESDLAYEPLTALLNLVQSEKPDVLVLLGPFVDSDHPSIKKGNIDVLPDELFKKQISAKLEKLMLNAPRTIVMLIPNQRDLVNHHVAYPQAPFSNESLGLPSGVRLLPNPTTFSVNEIVFATTSVDVLFGLRQQEYFRKCGEVKEDEEEDGDLGMEGVELEDPSAKDVMARTCRHFLRQRSFYPLFPAPLGPKGVPSLNLDVTHRELIKMGAVGVDVVILPSMLKHFTRIVDSTIMINPSFLTRGNGAGTFVRLTIHPMDKTKLEDGVNQEGDEEIEHQVWERCRVDTIKI